MHAATDQSRRLSHKALWWIQTALFVLFFIVAGGSLAVFIISMTSEVFVLALTRLGTFVLVGLLLVILQLLSVTLLRLPREALTAMACWAGLGVALMLWSFPLSWRTPLAISLVCTGLLTLGVVSLVRTLERPERRMRIPAGVLTILGLLVLLGVLGLALMGAGFGSDVTSQGQPSPGEEWSLTYCDIDLGGFGGDTVVLISRDFLGLVRQQRPVFTGEWQERPAVEWLDARTLMIDGVRLDIYTDPELSRW
jgi:hypothetical protein